MVFIPPETFRMGSPTNEVDRFDWEGPQPAVTISRGFWMGKYEVTQGEYEAVIGSDAWRWHGNVRWAHWWNSTEESPDDVTNEQVLVELNTDFSMKGMTAHEIQAVVAAWQANAIGQDTMTELFRRGEVLPKGRTLTRRRG